MYVYNVMMLIERNPKVSDGFIIRHMVDEKPICTPTHFCTDKDTDSVKIMQMCMPLSNSHRMVYEILVALEELDLHDTRKIEYTCLDSVRQKHIDVHHVRDSIWEIEWIGGDMRPRKEKVDVRRELNNSILKNYVRVDVTPITV